MVIGLLQLELLLEDTRSLKDKRSVLSRLRAQIRKKYNVSFSETDLQDIWRRAEITMTTASNESKAIDRMFASLEGEIDRFPPVSVIKRHMELL